MKDTRRDAIALSQVSVGPCSFPEQLLEPCFAKGLRVKV